MSRRNLIQVPSTHSRGAIVRSINFGAGETSSFTANFRGPGARPHGSDSREFLADLYSRCIRSHIHTVVPGGGSVSSGKPMLTSSLSRRINSRTVSADGSSSAISEAQFRQRPATLGQTCSDSCK